MQLFEESKQSEFHSEILQSIIINYDDLMSQKNLTQIIEKAYGPKGNSLLNSGHGILFVKGIPGYPQARKELLKSIWLLGTLSPQSLKKYQRPQIFHTRGWSKGKEQYQGQYDEGKGSYYMNCCTDEPLDIPPQEQKFYTEEQITVNKGNVWVDELPQMQHFIYLSEKNVKKLSKLMISTGELLAKQIDFAASKNIKNYEKNHLERIIHEGNAHIGRMLHYFPFSKTNPQVEADWCGWHNDHGALTALTSAMYMDQNGNQVSLKLKEGGLYAKNRFGEMQRIVIPSDMLAFQLGEVSQIITGGYLQATPHCVVKSQQIAGKRITRETFALFMQPNGLDKLCIPQGIEQSQLTTNKAYKVPDLKKRWQNGIFFKDFHLATIRNYS